MRKDHAEHNEKLCDHLLNIGQYNDWVTTTAFYSALHFVQHKIFPHKYKGVIYPDLNTYFLQVAKRNNQRVSKHMATIQLVQSEIPSIAAPYRWLYDACMTARYSDYKVTDNKAITARQRLTLIKLACI